MLRTMLIKTDLKVQKNTFHIQQKKQRQEVHDVQEMEAGKKEAGKVAYAQCQTI